MLSDIRCTGVLYCLRGIQYMISFGSLFVDVSMGFVIEYFLLIQMSKMVERGGLGSFRVLGQDFRAGSFFSFLVEVFSIDFCFQLGGCMGWVFLEGCGRYKVVFWVSRMVIRYQSVFRFFLGLLVYYSYYLQVRVSGFGFFEVCFLMEVFWIIVLRFGEGVKGSRSLELWEICIVVFILRMGLLRFRVAWGRVNRRSIFYLGGMVICVCGFFFFVVRDCQVRQSV